jgi:prepilin-type N-terminal cleavage/methylation domain-containing protein
MTLVELMVVVAIVGVLAAVAVFMFGKTSKQSRTRAEVSAFFSEFKVRQEQYAFENGTFLATGASESDPWPAAPSSPDAPNTLAPVPATWTALKMVPDTTTAYCSYVAIAGLAGDDTNVGPVGDAFAFTPPATNWYYVVAECDLDGDPAVNTVYFARSDLDGMQVHDEGR